MTTTPKKVKKKYCLGCGLLMLPDFDQMGHGHIPQHNKPGTEQLCHGSGTIALADRKPPQFARPGK